MKSRSNWIQRRSANPVNIVSFNPAFNESPNAARKISTEFIDIGWHVIIIIFELGARECALQTLQLLQGFGETGQGARGSLGIYGILRLALQPRSHGFNGAKFLKHRAMQSRDRLARRRQSRPAFCRARLLEFSFFLDWRGGSRARQAVQTVCLRQQLSGG
ncbi:MAG TPA: hypothetical protein VJ800_04845 [Pseudolabrys sp.]|nr:hypothetical protein [Pseudolabrys sp.]